ncbi:MAG: hypothetical protein HC802_14240 [Caldilineaceae bacterium]|nr:hypothetical protein [Caldilineaceae bacterium]
MRSANGQILGDGFFLPTFKVLNPPRSASPQHPTNAEFAELGRMPGYDLGLPDNGLHPGSTFTLTLYYQAQESTPVDYTQFVHLSDGLNMIAQYDGQPQQGANPTSAWIPGELIVDEIQLQIDENAAPGEYQLATGLYDAAASGARLNLYGADGQPIPDDALLLAELTVE